MIANPIIRKEVLSSLRTNKAIILQALFLLVLAALVWVFWPPGGLQDIGGQKARNLLAIIAIGELLMVAMFSSAFTAAAITTEKERNTWEVLFSSSMKPWEIALGKMSGSLSFLLLLVFSGIPALAALFLLGGVQGTEVIAVIGVLFLTAIYLGMIGLLVSSLMYRSYRSVIVAYGIVLVVCFVVAVPAWPVSGGMLARQEPGVQKVLHVVASLSPLQAMLSLVMPGSDYTIGAAGMPEYWRLFIPISCLVILGTGLAGVYKLRQPIKVHRQLAKLKVIERGQISARSFLFIVDPRKRKRMIRWWQNPMLIKEFRTRPMLQAQWLLRVIGLCLIVSVVLMILVSLSLQVFMGESSQMLPTMATAVAAMMVVLVLLVGPAMAGGTISSDRETGIWDLIRVTRMPSWRMVSGKFQASIVPLLLFALATLPALLILLYINIDLWPNMVRICYVIGVTILFVSTAGTFFSSVFSRTATATACTYALVMGVQLLTMLVLLGRSLFSVQFVESILVLNPVMAAMDAAGHASMKEYVGLMSRHMQIMGVAIAVMFVITVVRVYQLRRPE